ncbi:MAG: coiled-coil domain-containing protein, partial [Actinomycetes bacterium]
MGSTRRSRRSLLTCVAVATAVIATLATVPGSATADPQPTIREVQRRVDALHHEAEQSAERYNEARERMSDVRRRLAAVRNRLERQQAAVAALQASIGQLAAASYKAGGLDPVMQLVLSEDPAAFLAQASALGQLSRRQSEALTGVTAARQRLARDRLAVAHQKARVADLRDRLAAERRAVEGKLSAARALLDTLE